MPVAYAICRDHLYVGVLGKRLRQTAAVCRRAGGLRRPGRYHREALAAALSAAGAASAVERDGLRALIALDRSLRYPLPGVDRHSLAGASPQRLEQLWRLQDAAHAARDVGGIRWVERPLEVPEELRDRGGAAGGHGCPAGHRLQDRHPGALVQRWEDEQLARPVEGSERAIGDEPGEHQLARPEPQGTPEYPKLGAAEQPDPADDHELMGGAEPLRHLGVGPDRSLEVLAGIVPADVEEEAGPHG